jgi:hypothetical protein
VTLQIAVMNATTEALFGRFEVTSSKTNVIVRSLNKKNNKNEYITLENEIVHSKKDKMKK